MKKKVDAQKGVKGQLNVKDKMSCVCGLKKIKYTHKQIKQESE